MLKIAVAPDQKVWVQKLPAVEFALNMALSDVSGYSPFFLNYGGQPRPMLWDLTGETLPGVKSFMRKLQDGLINAHDAILTQQVKQSFHANQKRWKASFTVGDLGYLYTENLSILKGRSRKLSLK